MKDDLEWTILEALKEKAPNKERLFLGRTAQTRTDKAVFYYPCVKDNIWQYGAFVKNYQKAFLSKFGGHETATTHYGTIKMAAIKSSAAEIVNTLGNDQRKITIKRGGKLPAGTYAVEFEKPLRCLDPRHPAMIDAYLTPLDNGSSVILDENKVLEYLNGPSQLSDAYLDEKNYLKPELSKEYCALFKEHCLFQKTTTKDGKRKTKWTANTQYDVFQLIKHSLGFLNEWLESQALQRKIKHVVLINSVLYFPDRVFKNQPIMLEKYRGVWAKESASAKDESLIKEINEIYRVATKGNLDFSFVFLAYQNFIEELDLEKERKVYLSRYLL
jgi:hypothetical protein